MSTDSFEKRITLGILAHVDAGKTTLSETLLHLSGAIRSTGRVDHGDTFLDTDAQERRRGITIYAKQAVFRHGDTVFTLLDTPGHVDFSAETERTLQVLDAAVLVVSAPEGIQSHTRTLFALLKRYQVPVFVFVNKMDQPGTKRDRLLEQLNNAFQGGFFDFTSTEALLSSPEQQESLALLDEALLNRYLEEGTPVGREDLGALIRARKLFPCCFGSALREEGVDTLLDLLSEFAAAKLSHSVSDPAAGQASGGAPAANQSQSGGDPAAAPFGARVFKITRDEQGARLTWLKVTSGTLKSKMLLTASGEKAEQLRLYSGTRWSALQEAGPGTVLAVTGLTETRAGDGLGTESGTVLPLLSPVLSYAMTLPDGVDAREALPRLKSLEEELPELHVDFDEASKEIRVRIMGAVQTEVLQQLVMDRFGYTIGFSDAAIAYKETISTTVEGVGHFEPLRHYAEVHLVLSPGEPGSGLQFDSTVPTDQLATNWQRLVLTHLEEREHKGVLTGSPITDMKITLVAGKAHLKHTEGGDFRQATYRAVRNGLMEAESVLLEPWYAFSLRLPQQNVGRAFTDLDRMGAKFSLGGDDDSASGFAGDGASGSGSSSSGGAGSASSGSGSPGGGFSLITGEGPVSELRNYAEQLRAYTAGAGELSLRYAGYRPCHNAEEVIAETGYDPELDLRNTADSVFCAHGSSTVIPWYEVKEYMHLPSVLSSGSRAGDAPDPDDPDSLLSPAALNAKRKKAEQAAGDAPLMSIDEIDAIIERTFFRNRKDKHTRKRPGVVRRHKETLDYSGSSAGDSARGDTAGGGAAGNDKASGAGGSGAAGNAKATGAGGAAGKYASSDKKKALPRKEYLLVDGYNIIFAWEELRDLARLNVDSARDALLDILCDYQGYLDCTVIAVFDAYRVAGHREELLDYYNIHVVFTKEAQTADSYIEQFSETHAKSDRVMVATSDGMEQIIVRSQGSELLSAADLKEDILRRQAGRAQSEPATGSAAPKNRPFAEKLKELGKPQGE